MVGSAVTHVVRVLQKKKGNGSITGCGLMFVLPAFCVFSFCFSSSVLLRIVQTYMCIVACQAACCHELRMIKDKRGSVRISIDGSHSSSPTCNGLSFPLFSGK